MTDEKETVGIVGKTDMKKNKKKVRMAYLTCGHVSEDEIKVELAKWMDSPKAHEVGDFPSIVCEDHPECLEDILRMKKEGLRERSKGYR